MATLSTLICLFQVRKRVELGKQNRQLSMTVLGQNQQEQ